MEIIINNVAIKAITAAIPAHKIPLLSLAPQFGELEILRIIRSTGIESVRVVKNETTADLCLAAAKNLLSRLTISEKTIDALVLVTQTPDYVMPATSVVLQHALGLETNCLAFDINYGCSGYIYGLYQAAMLIHSGGCRRVLVCAGDVVSRLLNPVDRHVRLVFGDAASATLLEVGNDTLAFVIGSDGGGAAHLTTPIHYHQNKSDSAGEIGFLHMNGSEVMNFALREVPPAIERVLALKGWQKDQVDLYALHQANVFMLDYLRKKMQLSKKVVPIAVTEVGNTGPASIPLMLSLKANEFSNAAARQKVVMCGFGVGLSWAAAGLSLGETQIIVPVEVNKTAAQTCEINVPNQGENDVSIAC